MKIKIKSNNVFYIIDTKYITYLKNVEVSIIYLYQIGREYRYSYKIGMLNEDKPIEIIVALVFFLESTKIDKEKLLKARQKANKEFKKIQKIFLEENINGKNKSNRSNAARSRSLQRMD